MSPANVRSSSRGCGEIAIASGAVQSDETPVTYLDPGAEGGSSTGYFWVFRQLVGEDVIFAWRTSREHKHLGEWLGPDFEGIIQSDGYGAYPSYCRTKALKELDLQRAACLAHFRRKF